MMCLRTFCCREVQRKENFIPHQFKAVEGLISHLDSDVATELHVASSRKDVLVLLMQNSLAPRRFLSLGCPPKPISLTRLICST